MDGDTKKVADEIIRLSDWDLVDLNNYKFTYYDYEHLNYHDDFIGLMKKITSEYDVYVFATPVYWYSMSGIMKVFFDRISDLLTLEKEVGRSLRTKSMAVISCSNGDKVGDHFWIPFRKSADYLGMKYLTEIHVNSTKIMKSELSEFIYKVENP